MRWATAKLLAAKGRQIAGHFATQRTYFTAKHVSIGLSTEREMDSGNFFHCQSQGKYR